MLHQFYRLSYFSVLFVIISVVCGNNERNVMDAIFRNYRKTVRPVLEQNLTLHIDYELRVYNIISVDEPDQHVTFLLWTVRTWKDQFLTWDPKDFDGCTTVKVTSDQIWLPDIYLLNTLDIESISLTDTDYIDLSYDGQIRQLRKLKAQLSCVMAIGEFPFDTQICPITVGLWAYNYSELILHLRFPVVGLAPYNGDPNFAPIMGNNSEFETVSFTGVEVTSKVGLFSYSELHYSIGLKRRPAYYIFVVLIPSYLLTSLCIIGIFTPNSNINERNERVTLGLTTLLFMAVILNIVADQMPKGKEGLPLLGIFVLYEIGICALAIVLSTFIIIFHQRSLTRDWKPPAFCFWISGVRTSKNNCGVSPANITRNRALAYERVSPDGSANRVIDKNVERQTALLQSVCSMFQGAIESTEKRLQEDEVKKYRELIWLTFFDTIDLVLLILLLLLNTLISYILLG
uniref:Neurotransmitter-gated ion-channel ligand-binding domain-containing protein n=1 Tax=Plectus sambesii TaxID=2011161 RepID=A0A914WYU1_9BILA